MSSVKTIVGGRIRHGAIVNVCQPMVLKRRVGWGVNKRKSVLVTFENNLFITGGTGLKEIPSNQTATSMDVHILARFTKETTLIETWTEL